MTSFADPWPPAYNFIYGRSDLETFSFATWRRMLLQQAGKGSTRQFDYGSALGNAELRGALCTHLRRSRAVVCDPSEVTVSAIRELRVRRRVRARGSYT